MANSFWETQFVLDPPPAPVERHGDVDLHLPAGGGGGHTAIVVVHGVPGPPDAPDARDWPLYRGYGALLAENGAVVAIPRLTVASPDDLTTVAARITDTADLVRADPRVDSERVALWFFSGAGLLIGDWLRDPPRWLRGLAATYPLLAPLPEWPPVDSRFHPIDVLATGGATLPPLVLSRVGRERPEVDAGVTAFTAAASRRGLPLHVVDVPNGRHGFDALDHSEESRAAVRAALFHLLTAL
ncbi:hypothetical protein O7602_08380 [Micromonospora sp. WMMD1128]|uniref:hypothetical protein n=1 Tax=Micromonospora sp. WMMD1128 TaxID=3015150 RepID=UPI00248A9585|nr:hypothetical protein [Micromonospora sp. WMMD1128]WBB75513.1 hypothetical protein O7602_08380 [Micromonospora sp. WMMD1128]